MGDITLFFWCCHPFFTHLQNGPGAVHGTTPLLVPKASYKKVLSCLLVNAHHLGLPLAIAQILVSNVDDQRMKRLFIQACPYMIWPIFLSVYKVDYRNTIAGSPPGEQFFFWKNKVRLSKIKFLNFCFLAKKISKKTLNSLGVTKCCKKN